MVTDTNKRKVLSAAGKVSHTTNTIWKKESLMRKHESANTGTNLCKNIQSMHYRNILLLLSQAMHLGLMYSIDSLYVQTGNDLIQPASFSILLVLLSRHASVTLSFADRSLRLTLAVVCARERRPLL